MKFTKSNMAYNREDMIDFARKSENVFYKSALMAYDTASEVVALAEAERDAAFEKLAMQIKLMDDDTYSRSALDADELSGLTKGDKIMYLISKGKFRLGHTRICLDDDA